MSNRTALNEEDISVIVEKVKKLPKRRVVEIINFIDFLDAKGRGTLTRDFEKLADGIRKKIKSRGIPK